MATLETVQLEIAGIGHCFYAPVGTTPFDIAKMKFGDESTYGEWKWLGDLSAENLVEFEVDGGDVNFKNTWDRKKVRALREDQTITGTINALNISRETFELAFGGGAYEETTDSYKVKSTGFAKDYAFMLTPEDGLNISALHLPKTSVLGSFPKWSVEEFTEIPLSLAIQAADDATLWEQFFPRPYSAAAHTGPVETNQE